MSFLLQPWWLVILPLGVAPVLYFFRRRDGVAGFVAVLTTAVVARLCFSMPFDWSVVWFGRRLVLSPADRMFLGLAFVLVTFYFLYALSLSPGRSFFPFVLIALGLLSVVAMVESMVLVVILLGIVATVMVLLVVQGRRHDSVRGGLQYLGAMVLAVPPLLIAEHLAEMRLLSPLDSGLSQSAAFLMALGFGLLLGAFPFQSWLYSISSESTPMVVAFILSITHGVIFFKLLEQFYRFPWLRNDGNILLLMSIMGFSSVIMGGVWAVFQSDLRKLLAWGALLDVGVILIGFSSASPESSAVLTLLVFNRAIAVSLLGMGMGILQKARGSTAFSSLAGVLWQQPLAVLAVAIGGLSLAGFPLTGGFTVRWLVIQSLPGEPQKWAVVFIATGILASIGYLRFVAATVGKHDKPDEQSLLLVHILIGILLALNVVLALYPQAVLYPLTQVLSSWGLSG